MKRFVFIVIFIAGVGFLGWQIYQKINTARPGGERKRRDVRVAVEIKPVEQGFISDVRDFTGTLHPRSQFFVAPKIGGRLKKLMFNIGDRVKAGQLIAVLDDDEYVQQVDQARAELQVAKANIEESQNALDIARRELDRTVVLRQKKIASESELDNAKSSYKTQEARLKVAMAQVVQKEAELKVAQVRLAYTKIEVPANNSLAFRVVGERYVHEGALLSSGAPIVSILDIRTVTAVIHVIERDYARMKIGKTATVSTDAYPGKTFTGRIIRIAPLLQEKSREARIEVEIPNDDLLLKPGMFVRVLVEFEHRQNVTVVPIEALIKRNGQQGVFVVDRQEKTARFVTVTAGIINGNRAEIVEPPLSGVVITLGHHLLEDGGSVILPETGPPTPAKTRRKPGRQNKALPQKQQTPGGR